MVVERAFPCVVLVRMHLGGGPVTHTEWEGRLLRRNVHLVEDDALEVTHLFERAREVRELGLPAIGSGRVK